MSGVIVEETDTVWNIKYAYGSRVDHIATLPDGPLQRSLVGTILEDVMARKMCGNVTFDMTKDSLERLMKCSRSDVLREVMRKAITE